MEAHRADVEGSYLPAPAPAPAAAKAAAGGAAAPPAARGAPPRTAVVIHPGGGANISLGVDPDRVRPPKPAACGNGPADAARRAARLHLLRLRRRFAAAQAAVVFLAVVDMAIVVCSFVGLLLVASAGRGASASRWALLGLPRDAGGRAAFISVAVLCTLADSACVYGLSLLREQRWVLAAFGGANAAVLVAAVPVHLLSPMTFVMRAALIVAAASALARCARLEAWARAHLRLGAAPGGARAGGGEVPLAVVDVAAWGADDEEGGAGAGAQQPQPRGNRDPAAPP